MTNYVPGLDVIILAGGKGTRMEGLDKADIVVDGERLIDVILDDLALQTGLMQVVVVTSRDLKLRPGVKHVAENPPFSGPLAAINAGVKDLAAGDPSAMTAILAVDAPDSAEMLDSLITALNSHDEADVAAVQSEGSLQTLCAVWNTEALTRYLRSIGEVEDRSVYALFDLAEVTKIDGTGQERDYDTLEELAAYGEVELQANA